MGEGFWLQAGNAGVTTIGSGRTCQDGDPKLEGPRNPVKGGTRRVEFKKCPTRRVSPFVFYLARACVRNH